MESKLKDIVESKAAKRRQLAAKPVAEKLAIVEQLAERALATRPDSSQSLPDEPWQIPATWRWDKLGNVARVIGGGTPSTTNPEYWGGDIPWITPADLAKHHAKNISYGSRNISRAGLEHSGAQMLPRGAVLFSSRAPIGYVAIAANPVATNQGFKSFVLSDELEPDFVYYYLLRARELAVALASGTTFLEISGKNAARLPIPIPPLEEQRRIVAEIEKQFTRLDAAIHSFKAVRQKIARYRPALLQAASVGGQVTDNLSRAAADPDKELPPLPPTWRWTTIAELLAEKPLNGISVKGSLSPPGVRSLRLSAMSDTGFDYSDIRYLPLDEREVDDLWITEGDFFVARGNGSLRLVGRGTAAQKPPMPTIFPDTMIRLRLVEEIRETGWLKTIWPAPLIRAQIERKVKTTAGIFKISQPQVMSIAVPLPPISDQQQIVADVDRRLSVINEVERVVDANLQRAQILRQSILQRAFSGQL
jgi:type I restriction enzyme, S subunit